MLWRTKQREWVKVPLTHSDQIARGVGLADMAQSIQQSRPFRMNGELGLHVLEVMESFHVAAKAGRRIPTKSSCQRPKPMPEGNITGQLA